MKTHKKGLLLGLTILSLVLAGCSFPGKVDKSKTIIMRLGAEPTILNPILTTDSASSSVAGNLFDGLLKLDENLEWVPELASSYTVSADKKTYTFKLKENVTWHDGTPLTADDVLFTFNKILDKKTNTVRRSNYIIDGKPIVFKAVDRYTFQATLPKPFAPVLSSLAMGILPKHLLHDKDINTADFNYKPVGSGPYVFKTWKPGQFVMLEQNATYHKGAPLVKSILYKILPDQNTATVAMEKGEIDTIGIQPKDYEKMKANKILNTFEYNDLAYTFMAFNLKNSLFQNPQIRKAISHAINKKALVNNILMGYGAPVEIPSSPASWAYPPTSLVEFEYSPSKSKQLLKESGYTYNTKTNLFEKNGKPLQFTLLTNKGNKVREQTAQIIQQFCREVGVKVNIRLMEWKSFVKLLNEPKDPKNFDAAMLGWSLGIDPDGYSIWHSSQYPKGFNFIGYSNKTVDKLLAKGREEISRQKRKPIYNRIYKEIGNDVPYLFLFSPRSLFAINKRIGNLSKPGPAGLFNTIETVELISE